MKRLVRPAAYTAASAAALWAFVWARQWSIDPLDWSDPTAWLRRVDAVDALVEVATTGPSHSRIAGIVRPVVLKEVLLGPTTTTDA